MTDKTYNPEGRYKVGKKLFIHAPPFRGQIDKKTGKYVSKRLARRMEPYAGAEPWKESIYYYWWEFLRRHEEYKKCCEKGGKGKFAKLYADFGNIHEQDDFWKWWTQKVEVEGVVIGRGEYLFAEPPARPIAILEDWVDSTQTSQRDHSLTINIPLEVRSGLLVKMFRQILDERKAERDHAKSISRALYPAASHPPRLPALHYALSAWDVWVKHKDAKPKIKKYEMCVMANIPINHIVNGETIARLKQRNLPYIDLEKAIRRRQNQAFEKYRRAAEDYIAVAAGGRFPERPSKS